MANISMGWSAAKSLEKWDNFTDLDNFHPGDDVLNLPRLK